jgi:hypothetical protein
LRRRIISLTFFVALNLKNISYQIQPVDLIKGEAVGFY